MSLAEKRISGLRVDFFESAVPVYVGQWFREIAVLDFERGERITGLTFWLSQETESEFREIEGVVGGLRIERHGSRRKRFELCLGDVNTMHALSWRENAYEKLVGISPSLCSILLPDR